MRFRTGENQYCGNHNGSSAQTQCAHILAAAIPMRFAACHNHCFANHNGSDAQNRRGPSGDHARRSPFWRLWVLRRERGAQRRPRAPFRRLWVLRLPLQRARGPAATTRAAGPSAVSRHCGEQGAQRRPRAPQSLLEALGTAPATAKSEGPSGDHARRRPFWRLWVLRLPVG